MTPTDPLEARLVAVLRAPITSSQAAQIDARVSRMVHRVRKRTVAALGLGLAILASLAIGGLSSLSHGDFHSRLRAFGVPPGAEIVAIQGDGDGDFVTVIYRDSSGQVHTIGGVDRPATPAP